MLVEDLTRRVPTTSLEAGPRGYLLCRWEIEAEAPELAKITQLAGKEQDPWAGCWGLVGADRAWSLSAVHVQSCTWGVAVGLTWVAFYLARTVKPRPPQTLMLLS